MSSTAAAPTQWVELQLACRGHPGKTRIFKSLLAYYQKESPHLLLQALPSIPCIATTSPCTSRLLDLVQLYEEVVANGGAAVVSSKSIWGTIAGAMKLQIQPSALASLYATWLERFEQHQIFGGIYTASNKTNHPHSSTAAVCSSTPGGPSSSCETIATHAEIQAATSIRHTPLPVVTKRLKAHRQQLSGTTYKNGYDAIVFF